MNQTFTLRKSPVKTPSRITTARRRPAKLTLASALADIFLVAVWGISIPGLMWLGAAAGF